VVISSSHSFIFGECVPTISDAINSSPRTASIRPPETLPYIGVTEIVITMKILRFLLLLISVVYRRSQVVSSGWANSSCNC